MTGAAGAGRVAGKVALISGAARKPRHPAGRGADMIAIDLSGQLDSVPYLMSTTADLAETVRQAETGREVVLRVAPSLGRQRTLSADGRTQGAAMATNN